MATSEAESLTARDADRDYGSSSRHSPRPRHNPRAAMAAAKQITMRQITQRRAPARDCEAPSREPLADREDAAPPPRDGAGPLRRVAGQLPAVAIAAVLNLMVREPVVLSSEARSAVIFCALMKIPLFYFRHGRSCPLCQVGIPFGASYFPRELSLPGKQVLGLRMFLFSTGVAQLAFTAQSRFDNSVGLQMVEVRALLPRRSF